LTFWVAVIAVAGIAASGVKRDSRIEAFIPAGHESMKRRQEVRETFGIQDPIVVAVVSDRPTGIFDVDALGLLTELTRRARRLPGVNPERVTSLATVKNIQGSSYGMDVGRFFDEPPETQEEADRIRSAALDLDLYVGNLVSGDGQATVVVVELLGDEHGPNVYRALLRLAAELERPGVLLHVAGGGAVTATMGEYIAADNSRLNPFAVLVIGLILFIAFRTLYGVLLPNLVVLVTVLSALGSMALSGTPVNVITNALPVVLIALAVADGLHILSEYYERRALNPLAQHPEVIADSLCAIWWPCTVTTLTTIAGFGALYLGSWMPPMKQFALFGTIGLAIELAAALTLIPAALVLLPERRSPLFAASASPRRGADDSIARALDWLGAATLQNPRLVVLGAVVLAVGGVLGATNLQVNDSRVANFNRDEPIRQADRRINEKLGGTNFLDVILEHETPGAFLTPAGLAHLDALDEFAETLPHVKNATSLSDFLKQMKQAIQGGEKNAYSLPETAALSEQLLLLYAAGGDQAEIDKTVDYDYQSSNVRVALDTGLHSDRKKVLDRLDAYIAAKFNDGEIRARLAGPVHVDVSWVSEVGRFHFRSTALSLFSVWLMMCVFLRSVRFGTTAVLPVVLSILFIYALMGFTGIWLGVGTSMFAAIAIGTGVDFAVHSIDRLTRATWGPSRPEHMFTTTGRALLFSAACVGLGFAVLTTSAVPSLRWFGLVVFVAVMVSFIASMTVLPAVLYLVNQRRHGASRF
jgi:predicted RND superfamily exporter protein